MNLLNSIEALITDQEFIWNCLIIFGLSEAVAILVFYRASLNRLPAWAISHLPRVSQRLGFWVVALFFTFLGPLLVATPTWPPSAWVSEVNREGAFRDIVLAAIGMGVLAASNMADNLVRRNAIISTFSKILWPVMLTGTLLLIFVGVISYVQLPDKKALAPDVFDRSWKFISGILWAFLALEVLIAAED